MAAGAEDGRLGGRTALVTGASRGIGSAVAHALAGAGARVVACARSEQALAAVARALPGSGHLAVAMDVADKASLASALARIEREAGRIDVLVCNAGVADSAPYDRTDDATWERALAVNATGPFRLCRALVPAMVAAGWGRVVLVASNAGLTGYAYTTAYCASKHAVLGMMRALALEIARTPVTINAVCPGWTDTDMARAASERIAQKTGRSAEEARATLAAMSPQRRLVQPEEVAHAVLALCDERARGIHGQAWCIDGGQLLR
jgi:NAD(P)-dependent dehydrogenase (short-subunit alcohol dehydrogenase family)